MEALQYVDTSHVLRVFFFHVVQSIHGNRMSGANGSDSRPVNAPEDIVLRSLNGAVACPGIGAKPWAPMFPSPLWPPRSQTEKL